MKELIKRLLNINESTEISELKTIIYDLEQELKTRKEAYIEAAKGLRSKYNDKYNLAHDRQLYYQDECKHLQDKVNKLYRWATESKEKYMAEYAATNAMRYALTRKIDDNQIKQLVEGLTRENFEMFERAENAEMMLMQLAKEQQRLRPSNDEGKITWEELNNEEG